MLYTIVMNTTHSLTEKAVPMQPSDQKRAVSMAYSLPRWMVLRVRAVADDRGMSASQLVQQSIRLYFAAHQIPLGPHDDLDEAS
jgi:hypothetical protein